jgi:hypothetical protein
MNCCLWLYGEKVRSAEDIYNNFDPASLRGYFFGGSLVRWLKANGGEREAQILEETGSVYATFGFPEPPLTASAVAEALPVTDSVVYSFSVGGSRDFDSGAPGASHPTSGSGSGTSGYGIHII